MKADMNSLSPLLPSPFSFTTTMVSDHRLLSPLSRSTAGTNDLQTIRARWISLYSTSYDR
ncbi:hypothetical protein RchiOBHm_Chr4g0390221 [Rosa chinensis]|uniref:Uncharacterized protein n=1 Tax=Rosa chinensis TaxID=74649 RepID=A0A2P6QQA5_ROSCH|nr:hypothetical protein RchiOBHm_Chr4g0390221 [Rosa chinensis]